MQPTILYLQTILQNSYITYTSLLCHWYCIGVGLVNTFANTSLKLCVLFTLHTAHCSHLFSRTLFALQTADTSLMQRCLSQYWLKFFQNAGPGCDCWPTRKICGKRFNRAGNFPRGGVSSTFCSSHISKAEFIFSASPKTQLLSAASSCNFPSSQSNALRGKGTIFTKKYFVHRSVWVWVGEVYGIESMIKGDSEKRDFVRKEIL